MSRHFALTPYATWGMARSAGLPNTAGATAARLGGQVLLAGVALTAH